MGPVTEGGLALCFLDFTEFDDDTTRGAVLVTDERTRPLEFRVTDAVGIGSLQRLLYGQVLEEHLHVGKSVVHLADPVVARRRTGSGNHDKPSPRAAG